MYFVVLNKKTVHTCSNIMVMVLQGMAGHSINAVDCAQKQELGKAKRPKR